MKAESIWERGRGEELAGEGESGNCRGAWLSGEGCNERSELFAECDGADFVKIGPQPEFSVVSPRGLIFDSFRGI
jgi:hypothetical protein